jgi:hypothetical protein
VAHVIAWCGFLGAWLLVLGPLNQAIREVQEEEFSREAITHAARAIEVPPPVSGWWLLLPPVYFVLRRRRDHVYRQRVREAMSAEDVQAFDHLRDVAGAWFLVSAGAALIAVKETWGLREEYAWPEWSFWALLVAMLVVSAAVIAARMRRPDPAG